ncbi:MAG: hypothetical protein EOP38_02760 [Rubrivivax sp.]|nr:MAG: hypothetical protein EOP38_02760 [Rubrivivax sp.]
MDDVRSLDELSIRKRGLQSQSADLRHALVVTGSQALSPAFHALDRVAAGGHWVRTHPIVLVGIAALLIKQRPRRLLSWGIRAWGAWRLWRKVRPLLAQKKPPLLIRG